MCQFWKGGVSYGIQIQHYFEANHKSESVINEISLYLYANIMFVSHITYTPHTVMPIPWISLLLSVLHLHSFVICLWAVYIIYIRLKCIQMSLLHHDIILNLILYLCGRIKFIKSKLLSELKMSWGYLYVTRHWGKRCYLKSSQNKSTYDCSFLSCFSSSLAVIYFKTGWKEADGCSDHQPDSRATVLLPMHWGSR